VIVSSYSSSSSSSGCLLLCRSLWLSCYLLLSCHLGNVHGLWLWLWCWCGSGHVGQTLVPLDVAEIWALSDRPICSVAFNPFLSQNVSDEKRERQTLGLRVLSYSMVHSFPEFLNLLPYDLGNGAPKTSVERIKGTEEQVLPLCLVSQRTHVPVQHHINEKKIPRNLRFAGCISVTVCILPLTHVETMSSRVSMGGHSSQGTSDSGGSWLHFKTAATSAMVTSTSLPSMEEKSTSGWSQSTLRCS
jgi:hypothetical protein